MAFLRGFDSVLQKILVLIDGSANGIRALYYAASLAKMSGGELIALNIIKGKERIGSVALEQELINEANSPAFKRGNEILGEAKREIGDYDIKVQYMLQMGDPGEIGLKVALKQKADTIVVGSRGFGTIKGILRDSVSKRLVQESTLPVIVIK